jgi:hypothetical protein
MALMGSTTGSWGGRPWGRVAAALAAGAILGFAGCNPPPTENVIVDCNGQSVRLTTIDSIKNDSELTDAEKRQKLIDMCITDEAVLDVLLE